MFLSTDIVHIQAAEPITTEPIASEPIAFEPIASEPIASDEPIASEPIASEPNASESIASETIASEPIVSESIASEHNASEPIGITHRGNDPAASLELKDVYDNDPNTRESIGGGDQKVSSLVPKNNKQPECNESAEEVDKEIKPSPTPTDDHFVDSIWANADDTAATEDDEEWGCGSGGEDDGDDQDASVESLIGSVPWTETEQHLRSVITSCQDTMDKAQEALRVWISICKAPWPSCYEQQDKMEAIEYLGEGVRVRAEDFHQDVTKIFTEHPARVLEELHILRSRQKRLVSKIKRNRLPYQQWPPRNSKDLAAAYVEVHRSGGGKQIFNG